MHIELQLYLFSSARYLSLEILRPILILSSPNAIPHKSEPALEAGSCGAVIAADGRTSAPRTRHPEPRTRTSRHDELARAIFLQTDNAAIFTAAR